MMKKKSAKKLAKLQAKSEKLRGELALVEDEMHVLIQAKTKELVSDAELLSRPRRKLEKATTYKKIMKVLQEMNPADLLQLYTELHDVGVPASTGGKASWEYMLPNMATAYLREVYERDLQHNDTKALRPFLAKAARQMGKELYLLWFDLVSYIFTSKKDLQNWMNEEAICYKTKMPVRDLIATVYRELYVGDQLLCKECGKPNDSNGAESDRCCACQSEREADRSDRARDDARDAATL